MHPRHRAGPVKAEVITRPPQGAIPDTGRYASPRPEGGACAVAASTRAGVAGWGGLALRTERGAVSLPGGSGITFGHGLGICKEQPRRS